MMESLKKSSTAYLHQGEDTIRQSPVASVLGAAAVGYLFRFVPVCALLGGLVRLLIVSVKPLILICGAVKLYDLLRSNRPLLAVEKSGFEKESAE